MLMNKYIDFVIIFKFGIISLLFMMNNLSTSAFIGKQKA